VADLRKKGRTPALTDHLPGTPLSNICSVEAERRLDTLILKLWGEFDLSSEEGFRDQVARALDGLPTSRLIVDLRGLTFMDSTGLRGLVWLHNHSSANGRDYAVLYDGAPITRVVQASGLDQVLPTVDTAEVIPPPAA
jgi:anti-anti-sigma factor